jgi:hypothetical protein
MRFYKSHDGSSPGVEHEQRVQQYNSKKVNEHYGA